MFDIYGTQERKLAMQGTKTKASGTADKARGKAQHAWGELTDDNEVNMTARVETGLHCSARSPRQERHNPC
jgi:hypothetical protein